MNIHIFDPVIYPYKLWIVINNTPAPIADTFLEYNRDNIVFTEEDLEANAFTFPVLDTVSTYYGVVIYFKDKNKMNYETVAHEATHAAKFLFDHISADIEPHEPFEYVVGWIARCCGNVKLNKL